MTELEERAAELRYWLPEAEARITLPDSDGATRRGQPASAPPWNPAAAAALLDVLEGLRRLEAAWRGRERRAMAHTGTVLTSIVRLAEGADGEQQRHAAVLITRWTVAIMQLPSVDKAERPLRVPSPCPYCGFGMLRVFPRSGRVTCLLGGAPCTDADGNPPAGVMGRSGLDGSPVITWADGLVT